VIDRRHAILAALLCAAGCSDLPRDPRGTLGRVRGGRLRVGLVEQRPWVARAAGEPSGAEVELVRQLAGELGSAAEWTWGGEQQHMEALAQFELDLVAGGLTDDSPWGKRVGLTKPYFEDRVRVGTTSAPADLRGLRVAVKAGDPVAAELRKRGAEPVPVPEVTREAAPVAAPDWQLEQLGLNPGADELQKRKHVLAVPPGENGWLVYLEEFLHARTPAVKELLQREVARA
jgi:polar amino acid transport system substrate-binding protein